jgi:nicotinate-nucleotide adenylyltransferase
VTGRRTGILGGTFDPIHCGHVDLAAAAEEALGLSRLFVVTSNIPPHRSPPFASAWHRFAMVSMTVAGRPGWRASDLELRAGAQSFTSETLEKFNARGYSSSELFFVLGADAFADISVWHAFPRIFELAHFAVVSRPAFPVGDLRRRFPALAARMKEPPIDERASVDPVIVLIDAITADVSSTAIRQRRREGRSIAGLVPPGVQQHIEQHGLYASFPPGRRRQDPPGKPAASGLHD